MSKFSAKMQANGPLY